VPLGQAAKEQIGLMMARVRRAVDERGASPAFATELLRRGERDVRAWIQALRAAGAGSRADARTAALPTDTLFRIVEDPRLGSAERAAAAVALDAAGLDDAGRQRLTAAANATAGPKLRVVLQAARDADDEALAEAMAAMEADQVLSPAKGTVVRTG
jgi:hypothetical protein